MSYAIIARPSGLHESFCSAFNGEILYQARNIGLLEELRSKGSIRLTGGGTLGQREPDGCFQPTSARATIEWPTVILEVGWTQSMASLRQAMQWWFQASSHAVKIVILVKIQATSTNSIIIEKWIEQPPPPPAHMTRAASHAVTNQLVPTRAQEVLISSSINFTPTHLPQANDFQVTSDPLVIEFGLLFLRAPAVTTNAGDLILTGQRLRQMAVQVFEYVAYTP